MNIFAFYQSLSDVSLEEFGARFGKVESYAFRLELLQQFIVDDEVEPFSRYKSGEKTPPKDYNSGWRDLIASNLANGVAFERVRYLSTPLTDYSKFEIAWAYSVNIEAGEKISIIVGTAYPNFETEVPILKDFWVFDDRDVYLMEYDILGRFLGVKSVPTVSTEPYIFLMRESKSKAQAIKSTAIWKEYVCQ